MNRIVRALPALFVALTAGPVSAHDQPYSYLDLRLHGTAIDGRVAAHVIDVAHETGLAVDSLRDGGFVLRKRAAIERAFLERLDVRAGGRRIDARPARLEIVPDGKLVAMDFTSRLSRAPAQLDARGPLFAYDPQHETYLNVFVDGVLRVQDLLTRDRRESICSLGADISVPDVLSRFVLQGVRHIFLGPDHILFVAGLLLLGGGLRRLLKIVTAFTAAHSLTLAAATLGWLEPSPRIVEPAIAASIVFVGIENLRHRLGSRDRRALLAFCFGLVHGFGFASVLRETGVPPGAIGWSLFSFNLGVEMGQATIVLTLAPLLAWVRAGGERAAWRLATAGSWVIVGAGGYWLAERLLAR